MAKKKAAEKGVEVLKIPVAFGKVSIGETIASIPISASLQDLSLATARDKLCGKRIIGSILARGGGAQARQSSLPGADGDIEIDGAFDIKSFSFNKKKIGTTISFALESIDVVTLAHFAKREGFLSATGMEDLPDKPKKAPKGDDDDDDELDDDDL